MCPFCLETIRKKCIHANMTVFTTQIISVNLILTKLPQWNEKGRFVLQSKNNMIVCLEKSKN